MALFYSIFASLLDPILVIAAVLFGWIATESTENAVSRFIGILLASAVAGLLLSAAYQPSSKWDGDRSEPFDPDYSPFEDIQGTKFQQYSDWFVEARNENDTARIKQKISAYESDCLVILGSSDLFPVKSIGRWSGTEMVNFGWTAGGMPLMKACRWHSMIAKTIAMIFATYLSYLGIRKYRGFRN